MQQLRSQNPALATAIMNPDPAPLQALLRASAGQRATQEAERNAEIDRLNADPFDMEAQQRIEVGRCSYTPK